MRCKFGLNCSLQPTGFHFFARLDQMSVQCHDKPQETHTRVHTHAYTHSDSRTYCTNPPLNTGKGVEARFKCECLNDFWPCCFGLWLIY